MGWTAPRVRRLCGRFKERVLRAVVNLIQREIRGNLGTEVAMDLDLDEAREERELSLLHGGTGEVKTIRDWLAGAGYVPPDDPTDVATELEALIDHLADLGIVVENADHLSDREVYDWLLRDHLGAQVGLSPNGYIFMSPIGGCSNEDIETYLTYYASDEDRETFIADWEGPFPEKKELPRKRSWYE